MRDTTGITRIDEQILVVIIRPHHLRTDEVWIVGLAHPPSFCWSSSVTLGHVFTMWKSVLFIIEESSTKLKSGICANFPVNVVDVTTTLSCYR